MEKQLERELRQKDKLERQIYDSVIAQNLIKLAIRLQRKNIINYLGEKIE